MIAFEWWTSDGIDPGEITSWDQVPERWKKIADRWSKRQHSGKRYNAIGFHKLMEFNDPQVYIVDMVDDNGLEMK